MKLEIGYTYQEDKKSEVEESWVYYTASTDDFDKAVIEADKYFKKFKRDNGWTKKVKLIDIRLLKNETSSVPVITIAPTPKPRKRRSKSTSKRTLPSSRKRTSSTQKA